MQKSYQEGVRLVGGVEESKVRWGLGQEGDWAGAQAMLAGYDQLRPLLVALAWDSVALDRSPDQSFAARCHLLVA